MRVAIVHPWFLALGGGEQTVGVLAEMYPSADIHTLFCDPKVLPTQLLGRRIITSKWNWLPFKYRLYRYLLPLYPAAIEAIDLRGYDLIISSDSCVTKGILIDDHATHVCFCHSPMRCLYDQYRETQDVLPWIGRLIFRRTARKLRLWDYAAAHRVTGFATNSRYISNRIRTYYGLESQVTYAPVRTTNGYLDSEVEDYYLCVGRLVDSKRVDIAIEACKRLNRTLIIVGRGRESAALRKKAGPTIQFADWVSEEDLGRLYARCKALLFASKEDFGIAPLECQAYGRPVIAYGKGGSLETIVPGVTGEFFAEQTVDSMVEAILGFEARQMQYDPVQIRANAQSFDTTYFKLRFTRFVKICMKAKELGTTWIDLTKNAELSDVIGYDPGELVEQLHESWWSSFSKRKDVGVSTQSRN